MLFFKKNPNLLSTITIMPKISNKGTQMPESPIRKLVPFSEIERKETKYIT
jgi:aspartate aminotransferase